MEQFQRITKHSFTDKTLKIDHMKYRLKAVSQNIKVSCVRTCNILADNRITRRVCGQYAHEDEYDAWLCVQPTALSLRKCITTCPSGNPRPQVFTPRNIIRNYYSHIIIYIFSSFVQFTEHSDPCMGLGFSPKVVYLGILVGKMTIEHLTFSTNPLPHIIGREVFDRSDQ
jgi:hypothetical protein